MLTALLTIMAATARNTTTAGRRKAEVGESPQGDLQDREGVDWTTILLSMDPIVKTMLRERRNPSGLQIQKSQRGNY